MKIGELAQVAQCTVETVRYYEKEGLLPEPARTPGNFRVYGPEHVERLRFIRNCRALDMSHEEIHTLLKLADQPTDGCGAINAVFDQHIAHVDERIRELSQLKQQISTQGLILDTLSMGMSDDLSAAVLEGATIVRVGTAIFGERNSGEK